MNTEYVCSYHPNLERNIEYVCSNHPNLEAFFSIAMIACHAAVIMNQLRMAVVLNLIVN
jgi:hypothetical protein